MGALLRSSASLASRSKLQNYGLGGFAYLTGCTVVRRTRYVRVILVRSYSTTLASRASSSSYLVLL